MAKEQKDTKKKGATFNLAFRGYARDEVDMHFTHVQKETQHLLAQLAELRQTAEGAKLEAVTAVARDEQCESELEATQSALNQMIAEVERLKAEADSGKAELEAAQVRVRQLEADEAGSREILKVAHKAAEEMREQARNDAQARMVAAEEHAQRVEMEARRRVKEIEEDEAVVRARYDTFLAEARALASGFVRVTDEARDNL